MCSRVKSVVVDDFHVIRAPIRPNEADAPLVVDADRVLSRPITAERLKAIARWRPQIVQHTRRVHRLQLTTGDPEEIRRKAFRQRP